MSPEQHILRGEHSSGRVWLDDRELFPARSQAVLNHSPSGFMWGYAGSGPAQLALAVLLEFLDEREALWRYQDFKCAFIARLPFDFEAVIPGEWIAARAEVQHAP